MKQVARLLLVFLTLTAAIARADLGSDVDAVLRDKLLAKATVGIEIVALGDTPTATKPMLRRSHATPLIPASNLKLVTTAAALERLGGDFKFDTRLVKRGNDLAIIGDGDPTLGDAELIKKFGWTTTTVFDSWAAAIKQMNVNAVGDVVVDDSVFDETFVHPNWPTDQLHLRYVAGVAGLNLNANCIDVYLNPTARGSVVNYSLDPATSYATVQNNCYTSSENAVSLFMEPDTRVINLKGTSPGSRQGLSVTVDDPALFAATVLSESLTRAGVSSSGAVRRDRTVRAGIDAKSPDIIVLAHHTTPLSAVLARANKDSMNLYAESLCKRLGFAASTQPGSWENGTVAMGAFLTALGVPVDQFKFDDGCGLSKQNALSAGALSTMLQHMFYGPNRQAYIDSLAIAGVDGTLSDRFRGTDLSGRVYAKSGFVNGVSTLSGYFQGRDDRWYAFSILMNGIPPKSNSMIKSLQERIVKAANAATR